METGLYELAGPIWTRNPLNMVSAPVPQRNWSISQPAICKRDRESRSSMEKLIECPLAWVFQIHSKLYAGDLVSLPDGNQMLGTLSHAIIEKILGQPRVSKPAKVEEKARELFDELVPQMASSLLHPGRELERQRFRKIIGTAVRNLMIQIESSKLQVRGL